MRRQMMCVSPRANLRAVLEGRTAIRRPSHLPHPRMALHPLDAQTRMEALAPVGDINDELTSASRKARCC